MKVVKNTCYGGFGLSCLAILELMKMKSELIKKHEIKEYYGGNNPNFPKNDWKNSWKEDLKRSYTEHDERFMFHYDNFNIYDKKESVLLDVKDGRGGDDFEGGQAKFRSHPDLVAVIEKLGEEANGRFANLQIVEIPDDVEFVIGEYDGFESVEEKHRSW